MRLKFAAIVLIAILVIAFVKSSQSVDSRSGKFRYSAVIPRLEDEAENVRLWIPLPLENAYQGIDELRVEPPIGFEIIEDELHGNRYLRVSGSADRLSGQSIQLSFRVTRRAVGKGGASYVREPDPSQTDVYESPNRLVPIDGMIAERATASIRTTADRRSAVRAIYDDVVSSLDYDKTGTGWGRGDALHACRVEKGNCTDFHSLFIAMCRSQGIPARFVMGFPLPKEYGSGSVSGYHCWAEFYVGSEGWIPVDASEASKHPEKRDYLFGNLDPDRIAFTRGRDLTFPGEIDLSPINYFIYSVLIVDGVITEGTKHHFAFRDAASE